MTKNFTDTDQSLSLYVGNFTLQIKHVKNQPEAHFILSYSGASLNNSPPIEVSLGVVSYNANEIEIIGVNLIAMASDIKRIAKVEDI
jgi:hypothetical protein